VIYPGYQEGIWSKSPVDDSWYLHHFYDFQPDLNFANPAVRDEIKRIMAFWLQLGIGGFRIDAAPFLIDLTGIDNVDSLAQSHEWLGELHDMALRRTGNAVLVGEVNVSLSKLADYFGGGNELQALFNFPLSRLVFLALALKSADPVAYGLSQLPSVPEGGQWVNFLRKHDELNLSQMPADERQVVYDHFGPAKRMQIYIRGIRRRLAPMLDGDLDRIKLAWSILFSLPGAPLIYYGDEIGMGDNLSLDQRLSVRTPMQWSAGPGGGFTGKGTEPVRPFANGRFGPRHVNVDQQRANPESLLNWIARLSRARRELTMIGSVPGETVDMNAKSVLAILYGAAPEQVLVLNNLETRTVTATLDVPQIAFKEAVEYVSDRPYSVITRQDRSLEIGPSGFRWFVLQG
jgi:maltose alpha-D-glucosyltransferase/alpha-amylase